MPKRKREEEEAKEELKRLWKIYYQNLFKFKEIPKHEWYGAPGQPLQHEFLHDFVEAQNLLLDEIYELEVITKKDQE